MREHIPPSYKTTLKNLQESMKQEILRGGLSLTETPVTYAI